MTKRKDAIDAYNGSQVTILEGLKAVRERPGMYIGSTGKKGLHHCIYEILDNSIDEGIQGFCNTIYITVNKDNSITIEDNGRGIPIDVHPVKKIPTVRVIMTILHAGGKFNGGAYKVSGGLHGVGASVVNALSSWLEVEVYRNGNIYLDRYENGGEPVIELTKKGELPTIGKTDKNGTKVTFLPDSTIFETTEWDTEVIKKRLKESAYLNKGVKIIYKNELTNEEETFFDESGIAGYIKELTAEKENLTDVIYINGKSNDIYVEVAMRYSKTIGEHVISYCNNIHTVDGGTHITGFRSGLTRIINNYAKKTFNIKDAFDGKDVRNGITAIISIKHINPQYEGQTKTKLGNSDAKGAVEDVVNKKGELFFDKNYETLKTIVDIAKEMFNLRQKETTTKVPVVKNRKVLSHKLADCNSKDVTKNEIYIVEGDSAGGTAKQARNRKHQAVLPLRGKILNVEKSKLDKILNSDTIRTMITAFGAGVGKDFDISKLRYHKIIIMTDADVDGAHIRTLLLTFFFRYMRELIDGGYVYIGEPPLYKVNYTEKPSDKRKKSKKAEIYLYDDYELDEFKAKKNVKINKIQRYKGLGEMNVNQLEETAFLEDSRRIKQVELEDAEVADELTSILMGDVVEPRKNLIIEEAEYAVLDY